MADETAPKQRGIGKPFPKGVSGNPAGRPKGTISLVTILKQRLEEIGPDQRRSLAEHFADNVIQDALELDGPSRKLLLQYVEGMPQQKTDITSNGEAIQPLLVRILGHEEGDGDTPRI